MREFIHKLWKKIKNIHTRIKRMCCPKHKISNQEHSITNQSQKQVFSNHSYLYSIQDSSIEFNQSNIPKQNKRINKIHRSSRLIKKQKHLCGKSYNFREYLRTNNKNNNKQNYFKNIQETFTQKQQLSRIKINSAVDCTEKIKRLKFEYPNGQDISIIKSSTNKQQLVDSTLHEDENILIFCDIKIKQNHVKILENSSTEKQNSQKDSEIEEEIVNSKRQSLNNFNSELYHKYMQSPTSTLSSPKQERIQIEQIDEIDVRPMALSSIHWAHSIEKEGLKQVVSKNEDEMQFLPFE